MDISHSEPLPAKQGRKPTLPRVHILNPNSRALNSYIVNFGFINYAVCLKMRVILVRFVVIQG
jgi:hypothetical protein